MLCLTHFQQSDFFFLLCIYNGNKRFSQMLMSTQCLQWSVNYVYHLLFGEETVMNKIKNICLGIRNRDRGKDK